MIQTLTRIALAASLAVSGAAFAQKAAETTNVPQRAGEASTMTGGAPNAKTSNDTTTTSKSSKSSKASKKRAKSGSGMAGASATSNVPDRAGEASTMTNGAPNKKTTN